MKLQFLFIFSVSFLVSSAAAVGHTELAGRRLDDASNDATQAPLAEASLVKAKLNEVKKETSDALGVVGAELTSMTKDLMHADGTPVKEVAAKEAGNLGKVTFAMKGVTGALDRTVQAKKASDANGETTDDKDLAKVVKSATDVADKVSQQAKVGIQTLNVMKMAFFGANDGNVKEVAKIQKDGVAIMIDAAKRTKEAEETLVEDLTETRRSLRGRNLATTSEAEAIAKDLETLSSQTGEELLVVIAALEAVQLTLADAENLTVAQLETLEGESLKGLQGAIAGMKVTLDIAR